jgi:lantibiotic modifying enzyme
MIEAAEFDQQLVKGEGKSGADYRQTLFRICQYLRNCSYSPTASSLSISEYLAQPVVRFAWNDLQVMGHETLLSPTAAHALRRSLRHRLAWIADQVISLELGRARNRNVRDRKGNTAVIKDFCPAGIARKTLYLSGEYSVLARLWAVQVVSWQQLVRDFLKHSYAFLRSLNLSADTGTVITAIRPDLSDPHDGGRTVIRVRFVNRAEWYYKPRTGCQEIEWFNLLRWLNDGGFALPFQIVNVKSKQRHCWMEAVRPKACRNRRELASFYFRAGALSYLIHLLRGVDFHMGNLVVAGEQPVFVDIETLLHPTVRLPAVAQVENSSILRTGLFPVANASTNSVSAFGQCSWPSRDLRLKSPPRVRSNFVWDLLAGFQAMHTFVVEKPERVHYLEAMVSRLAKLSGRTIYRPTRQYVSALTQSFAPSLMRDNLDRSLFLIAFCAQHAASTHQVLAEAAALENADIPEFRSLRRKIRLDFSQKNFVESVSTIRKQFNLVAGAL